MTRSMVVESVTVDEQAVKWAPVLSLSYALPWHGTVIGR